MGPPDRARTTEIYGSGGRTKFSTPRPARFLPFPGPGEQPWDKMAPEHDVYEQRRQSREQSARHWEVPPHRLAAGQLRERDGDRLARRIREAHREEELVPDLGELPVDDDHEPRGREREYNGPRGYED